MLAERFRLMTRQGVTKHLQVLAAAGIIDGSRQGDDREQRLVANPQADLAEQAVDSHFLDEATEPIAAAERDDQARRPLARSRPTGAAGVCRASRRSISASDMR